MPTRKPAPKTSPAARKASGEKKQPAAKPGQKATTKATTNPGKPTKKSTATAGKAAKSGPAFTKKGKGLARRTTRSQAITTPAYRLKSARDLGPEVAEILKFAGMQATRPLATDELQRLLKAPSDVFAIADNAAAQFEKDAGLLALRDFPAEQLKALAERALYLRVRPQHLQEAATIAQHQQLVATSDLQDALLRIRRRVVSLLDEWPELRSRWQFLLDYFERMYPGPGPGAGSANAEAKADRPSKPEGK
jgi:hypothetical protein